MSQHGFQAGDLIEIDTLIQKSPKLSEKQLESLTRLAFKSHEKQSLDKEIPLTKSHASRGIKALLGKEIPLLKTTTVTGGFSFESML